MKTHHLERIMRISTCSVVVVLLVIDKIGSINAGYLDRNPSKIEADLKHCEELYSKQTKELCKKRLAYCCRSGKSTITKPVCATTISGFGKIFKNPCSLYYIRCMYPQEIACFLKRAPSHPHCRYVLKQESSFPICFSTLTTTGITTKPPPPTTVFSTVSTQEWLQTTEPSTSPQNLILPLTTTPATEITFPTLNTTLQTTSSPSTSSTALQTSLTPNLNYTKTESPTSTRMSTPDEPYTTTDVTSALLSTQSTHLTEEGFTSDLRTSMESDITSEELVTVSDSITRDISTSIVQSEASTYSNVTTESLVQTTSPDSTTVPPKMECGSAFVAAPPMHVNVYDATDSRTRPYRNNNEPKQMGTSIKCGIRPPVFPDCTFPVVDRGKL